MNVEKWLTSKYQNCVNFVALRPIKGRAMSFEMEQSAQHERMDEVGVMDAPITRLLRDEQTDNCPLILELIAGTGVTKRLKSYLFGISVFHSAKETTTRAFNLLRSCVSPETLKQAEKLKESVSYHFSETDYLGKPRNGEIDVFDFLLASRMCQWHRPQANRNHYFLTSHQTLHLTHYPEAVLPPSFATLDFIRYLFLPAHKDFSIDESFEALAALPLESISMENVRLTHFPVALLRLPLLRTLSIRRGYYRPLHPMLTPDEGPYGSLSLEKLMIEGYPISGEGRLGPFPRLKEASLVRCSLESIAFLQQSQQLETLNVRYNLLETLPAFLSEMTELRNAFFSHNPLQKIEADLTPLKKLEELEIILKMK